MGQHAKELVNHGDITSLSIYANKLKQNGGQVYHGQIRELSLVLAGANPGAYIEDVIAHGDDDEEYTAQIYSGQEGLALYHADEADIENEEVDEEEMLDYYNDVFDSLTDEQKELVYFLLGRASNTGAQLQHSEEGDIDMNDFDTIMDSLTDEQYDAVMAMVDAAAEDGYNQAYDEVDADYGDEGDYEDEGYDDEDDEYYDEGDDDSVKHNVFDSDEGYYGDAYSDEYISHSEMQSILEDAKTIGSLRESALQHDAVVPYGIENIDYLFPEARNLNNPPDWIKRDTDWVAKVMGSVHSTPFSRIKSTFADITADDARAKGYTKGKRKLEEVFTLLKRTTTPTTVYKKQKLDRDDVIDITDFDVVAWIKTEMRMMLNEELARAYLVGDGRLGSSDDKINENCIRPIWTDDDLYTIKYTLADEKPATFVRGAIKSRIDYKGSGSPTLFITEDKLTDLLLMTDATGRDMYDSEQKLATKLRVSNIVTVPVLANLVRTDSKTGKHFKLHGIIVNLKDYNVGADKGGAVSMFDDFDIDYNAQKYLIETRCSGALIKPFSAIVLESEVQEAPSQASNSAAVGE
jgi:hypothetical protein